MFFAKDQLSRLHTAYSVEVSICTEQLLVNMQFI